MGLFRADSCCCCCCCCCCCWWCCCCCCWCWQNFKWFFDVLQEIESDPVCRSKVSVLLYCTAKRRADQDQNMATLSRMHKRISGLGSFRAHIGRPPFEQRFLEVRDEARLLLADGDRKRVSVGVFACAPEPVHHELQRVCQLVTDDGVDFSFRREQ